MRNTHAMQRGSLVAADSQTFYEGALVMRNSSGDPVVGADTASCTFLGVCAVALTTGSSNTRRIEFEYGHEEWFRSSLTKTSIGTNAVISDDEIVTNAATATNDVVVGEIVEAETFEGNTGVWVRVRCFV